MISYVSFDCLKCAIKNNRTAFYPGLSIRRFLLQVNWGARSFKLGGWLVVIDQTHSSSTLFGNHYAQKLTTTLESWSASGILFCCNREWQHSLDCCICPCIPLPSTQTCVCISQSPTYGPVNGSSKRVGNVRS